MIEESFQRARKQPPATDGRGSIPGIDRIGQQAATTGRSRSRNGEDKAVTRTVAKTPTSDFRRLVTQRLTDRDKASDQT
jgi:hypothetical protein